MPRSIPASIDAAIVLPITEPNYLVELQFTSTLRYATLRQTTWDNQVWLAAGAEVVSVSPEAARLSLRNHDNSLSALVLNQTLQNVPCLIYQHYDDDAELIFSGTLDAAPEIGPRVALSASGNQRAIKYPQDFIAPPLFNHLTPAGTEIRYGNVTLTLEAQT